MKVHYKVASTSPLTFCDKEGEKDCTINPREVTCLACLGAIMATRRRYARDVAERLLKVPGGAAKEARQLLLVG